MIVDELFTRKTTGAGVQTGDIYAIDPDTGKPYEKEKLAAKWGAPAPQTPAMPTTTNITAGGPTFNATNLTKLSSMNKYAKPSNTTNFSRGGYGTTTSSFNPLAKLKAPSAPVAPKAPKVTAGGPTPDEIAKYQAKLAAAAKAQPVAETIAQVKKMLETVQTRDDVAFIKKYINQEFQRHGLVSESAQTHRSHLLNEVTRIGALRRRKHSQQTLVR